MSRVAATIPAENDLLCEGCGYTLNGLPDDSQCPECGKPIAESTGVGRREPPVWESARERRFAALLSTSAEVLFRPTRFYRTLATRRDTRPARKFARIHWWMASVLLGAAAFAHVDWYLLTFDVTGQYRGTSPWRFVLPVILVLLTYLFLLWTTRAAARLTHWEASYRGLRLPLPVVLRGMYYHAAHYIPVGLVAAATTIGYQWILEMRWADIDSAQVYLYVLSAEVILAALYLFNTYWIGMRNMMYANR